MKIAGAAFERLFLRARSRACQRLAVPDPAEPLPQLKVREKEQADEIQCGIDDARAHGAQHPEKGPVQGLPNESPYAGRADGHTGPGK